MRAEAMLPPTRSLARALQAETRAPSVAGRRTLDTRAYFAADSLGSMGRARARDQLEGLAQTTQRVAIVDKPSVFTAGNVRR
jgi:hypothetical protein